MDSWFLYSLKVVIGSYAFYLLYYLLMRNETHFSMGRSYLLLSLASSLVVPLIPVQNEENILVAALNYEFTFDQVVVLPEHGILNTDNDYISIAFIAVSAIFLTLFLIRLGMIISIASKSKKLLISNLNIYDTCSDTPAFTFLNSVFIDKRNYTEKELGIILSHEGAHARLLHSLDIIFIELLQIVFWFNPVLLLYRNALASIHEYQADRLTLDSGTDFTEYGMLIIKETFNTKSLAFTNNFNSSIIKRRIAMMKRKESSTLGLLKPIAGLTLLVILIFTFSITNTEGKKPVEKQTNKETPAKELTAADLPPKCDLNDFRKNIVYPESARKEGIACKIFVKAYVNEKGKITKTEASVNEDGKIVIVKRGNKYQEFAVAAVKAVKNTKFTPAVKDGKNVGAWITIPVQYRLEDK
jgi:TonB family protein